MVNTRFVQPNVTINVGDTVTWRCDVGFHDTVSGVNGVPNGVWNSNSQFPGLMRPGNSFSVTFTRAGSFPYYCTPHWQLGMVGTINVQSVNAPPSVSMTSPPNGSSFDGPANVILEANASDPDGDVLNVEFFMNGNSLGVVGGPPYRFPVNNLGPGNYTFSAIARDGAASSAPAFTSITVNGQQPTISTGPQSQVANVGSDVTFNVQANGSPPLGYQWFFGQTPISGATGTSLLLTHVSPDNSGSYAVQVSNPFGSSSASATLAVTSPPSGSAPTLTVEPQSQTVRASSNVTFSAAAIGTTPLIWQWFFNGSAIPDATNASLELPSVTAANEGDYAVTVNNAFGSATSTNAHLTVIVAPVCTFVLSKLNSSFGPSGGGDNVTVTTPPGCAWEIENTNTWVLMTPRDGGIGTATVTFTVSSNTIRTLRTAVLIIAGSSFTITQTAAIFAAKNDFNHDGQTDFLFQNSDGRVNLWLMDGTTRNAVMPLRNGRLAAPGSRIVGTHDFDLDGNVDILWQRNDGALQIWLMNGTNFLRSKLIVSAPSPSPAWRVAGLGDFDRDLHTDILLRHAEGYLAICYLKGKEFLRQSLLYNGEAVSRTWRVAGVTDMNGDGYSDILWQNANSSLVVWFMSYSSQGGATPLTGPLLSNLPRINAKIVGLNDLNQDGKTDFIWRHTDGHLSVWWMNGTNRIGAFPIDGGRQVAPAWKLVAPRN